MIRRPPRSTRTDTLFPYTTSSDLESLAFYAYREPKAAKQLHIGVIPKAVDEYLQMRGNYAAQEPDKKLGNPVHHVHVARGQDVPQAVLPVSYGLRIGRAHV